MIRTKFCYQCQYYDKDNNNCPAYPKGIDGNMKYTYDSVKNCGNGVSFKEIKEEQNKNA